jgi:hypothetical protein
MMSLSTIRSMAAEAAEEAAEAGLEPFIVWPSDIERIRIAGRFPFPNLGDHVPDGWELVDEFMADASGFGAPDEPALTFDQLVDRLKEGKGYAITQVGQFQVMVGEFKRGDK